MSDEIKAEIHSEDTIHANILANAENIVNADTLNNKTSGQIVQESKSYTDQKIQEVNTAIDGKVEEAPDDGKEYARKNKAWVESSGGGGGSGATITVGTVTTGEPGSSASVTNVGTDTNAIFDFSIPAGANGEDGEKGDDGKAATIQVGTVTTGAAGTNASVENIGTEANAILSFTIPKGDKGEPGSGSGGGIEEAPSNGKLYGRKDATWEEITGGGSGGDADTLNNKTSTQIEQRNYTPSLEPVISSGNWNDITPVGLAENIHRGNYWNGANIGKEFLITGYKNFDGTKYLRNISSIDYPNIKMRQRKDGNTWGNWERESQAFTWDSESTSTSWNTILNEGFYQKTMLGYLNGTGNPDGPPSSAKFQCYNRVHHAYSTGQRVLIQRALPLDVGVPMFERRYQETNGSFSEWVRQGARKVWFADMPVVTGTQIIAAHNLPNFDPDYAIPFAYLVCVKAAEGYAVGEKLAQFSTYEQYGYAFRVEPVVSATNVSVIFGNGNIQAQKKDGTLMTAIPSDWNIRIGFSY